jgi:1,6-anhydro-N-acetylmuramate kinase
LRTRRLVPSQRAASSALIELAAKGRAKEARELPLLALMALAHPPAVVMDASSDQPQPRSAIEHPFVRPSSPESQGEALRRCRWTPAQLEDRAKTIAIRFAARSGHAVKLEDAAAVARLSLPVAAIVLILLAQAEVDEPAGLGGVWPALRLGELAYLAYETNRGATDAQVVPSQARR